MFWEVKYVDLPISMWKLVEAFYLKNYHKIWDILISFSHYFPSYFKVNAVYLSCTFSSLLWKCYLIIAFKNDRKYRKTRDKKNSIPKGNVLSILVLAQIFVCVCVCVCVCLKSLSCIWLFATPWTAAHQVPVSMGFSRQEYWSGLPFSSPGELPDPGIELGLPHCRQILYHLSHRVFVFS